MMVFIPVQYWQVQRQLKSMVFQQQEKAILYPHVKPKHPPHPRFISGGSSTVFIDGQPAARNGDKVGCGGTVKGGGTVNIG
jgi:uncharacterized Zn-binding protein involved in type VI secretion